MLVCREIHSPAPKCYAFHAEAQPLFRTGFETQLYLAAGAYNSLPGK